MDDLVSSPDPTLGSGDETMDDLALLAFGVAKGTHVDLFARSIQIHTSSVPTELPTNYDYERLRNL